MRIVAVAVLAVSLAAPIAWGQVAGPPGPPDVVRHFLGLDDAQAQQFAGLLPNRHSALAPLGQQLEQAERQLHQLLAAADPDPAVVGQQVLEIFGLHRQVGAVLESVQKDLAALLTQEQKEKLAAVELAARLMPIVPAFVELRLVAPPGPGPRAAAPQPAVIRLPQ